ncbi:peptide deformylase [Desulfobulbus alkaliphilus]|uniref:peptide deformylase n=1 Tax=Desulfobulbus alkaliphilus TaxID=869814 RepID=UPI001962F2E2|nr:peptide deformylase [Desulfobulbus alkaliphilus]MBM9536787.1 peptide deformylase [Desulfobulbus alkaliphilus]
MSIRKILTFPHPILRLKAEPITVFDEELHTLVQDMVDTMHAAPGVGLAANQIGIPRQLVVVDNSTVDNERAYLALVNPRITAGEGSMVDEEGCLSVVECFAKVKRFRKIHVTAQDMEGNPLQFDAEDRFARIIQHEVDHLLGTLFIDHLSTLKRALYKKKLKKILQEQEMEQQ